MNQGVGITVAVKGVSGVIEDFNRIGNGRIAPKHKKTLRLA